MAYIPLSASDRVRAFITGLVFLGIGSALFYFGGGEFICGEEWFPELMNRGILRGNGFILGSECAAISVNEKWYGIQTVDRFFDAPLIQVIMIGGFIGGVLFFLTMLRNAVFGVDTIDDD